MNREKWIGYALEQGFESFEVYQSTSEEKTLKYYEGDMESFVTSHVLSTSFRGLVKGKMTKASTEDPTDDQMEEIIGMMKDQADVITSDDVGEILKPEKTEEVHTDRVFKEASTEKILEIMKQIEEKILAYDSRLFQVTDMEYTRNRGIREIVNSYGLHVRDEDVYAIIMSGAAAKEGNEIRNDYKIELLEDPDSFDVDSFVKELCEEVLGKLNSSSLPSRKMKAIIRNDAMTSLFSAFTPMFSGELIGKGISPLKDKVDEVVFSEKITVIDDPKNTDCLQIANYDDEGHPTHKKTVVNKGVFKTVLHDTRSARRMKTSSTGNGFFGSVSPFNMSIEKGEKDLKALEEAMKEGLVITDFQGLHAGIDFVTTNFSLQCSGYTVKDGKRERSVSLITAAGNFLDLMKKAEEVGSDLDWKYHSVAVPSILFEEISIAGE